MHIDEKQLNKKLDELGRKHIIKDAKLQSMVPESFFWQRMKINGGNGTYADRERITIDVKLREESHNSAAKVVVRRTLLIIGPLFLMLALHTAGQAIWHKDTVKEEIATALGNAGVRLMTVIQTGSLATPKE